MGMVDETKVRRCTLCNRVPEKMVKLYDNGNGPDVCRNCKRAVKKNIPIKKYEVGE